MKRSILVGGIMVALVLASLTLSACGGNVVVVPKPLPVETTQTAGSGSAAAAAAHQLVTITEDGFSPSTVTVKVGGAVVWSNKGSKDHAVDLSPAGPKSKTIAPGASATHKFAKAGTYPYSDPLNPSLTGEVIVK